MAEHLPDDFKDLKDLQKQIADPPPPQPGVDLDSLRKFILSLGSLPIWHVLWGSGFCLCCVTKKVWVNAPNIAGSLVIAATCLYLGAQHGCTLPVPPTPTPTPIPIPVPSNPLTDDFQKAFDADISTDDKASRLANLTGVMQSVVQAAKTSGKCKTAGDFAAVVHTATESAVGTGKLMTLRTRIGAYLATQLPTSTATTADDAYWAKATAAYANVASALSTLKR